MVVAPHYEIRNALDPSSHLLASVEHVPRFLFRKRFEILHIYSIIIHLAQIECKPDCENRNSPDVTECLAFEQTAPGSVRIGFRTNRI